MSGGFPRLSAPAGCSKVGFQRRRAEQIALQAIHPHRAQQLRLGHGFDRLGHGEHLEMLANRQQRRGQHLIVAVAVDVADELAVDLQDVKEEILEIADGGIARAEIIQRKGNAFGLAARP